jgi:hypothetical protein
MFAALSCSTGRTLHGCQMVVQRLNIHAARDKLRVIHVWRCLARSGVKVVRWTVCADRVTGMETMTVDFVEIDSQHIADIAAELAQSPFEMNVTMSNLTTVPTHSSHGSVPSVSQENARLEPLL